MKNNLDRANMALFLDAPVSVAQRMAAGLLAASEQFGVKRDRWFPGRVCAVAFGNGLLAGARGPAAAQLCLETLRQNLALPPGCIAEAKRLACQHCANGSLVTQFWRHVLPCFLESAGLRLEWNLPSRMGGGDLAAAVAASALLGLECWAENRELAAGWMETTRSMTSEELFLTTRLFVWANTNFVPFDEPLIEFSCGFYANAPKDGAFINQGLAETLPAAGLRDNQWDLGFWSGAGWDHGRAFAADRAKVRDLVDELGSQEAVESLGRIYLDTVIAVAEANGGRLDVLRSTLAYFAMARGGMLARIYCRGGQPRLLVQRAFDYAAWMGLLSVFPQKAQPESARSQ